MSRKEMVQALEAKWAVKAKYLGMPSCAYEIAGKKGTFRIDKAGLIFDPDGREYGIEELLADAPAQSAGESKPAETGEPTFQGYAFSLEGHTVLSLRNLVNMLASKQALISAAFGLEQPLLERELAEELDWITIENVDAFVAVWLNLARGRAPGLNLDLATCTLILQLPKENPTLEEMMAFRDLAIGMDASAKKLKHSSLKPAQEENPKFAFRTWLIRLGMNGDEFKATRKVLLANLAGDSSFRSPKPAAASGGGGSLMDRFFTQTTCDRCGGSLSGGRILSMYSTECICMDCKEKERNRADYKQAAQTELDEVRKGNLNYKGIKG